jgi:class 3 adenylate cyclase/ketosteroid isomerase-like protein
MQSEGRGELERSEELRAVTARHWEALRRGEVEAVVARHSPLRGVSGFGTDPSEWFRNPLQIEAYNRAEFEAFHDGWPLGLAEIEAWIDGNTGWSSVRSVVTPEAGESNPLRVSFLFHLEQGDWKIVHQHWSFGVANASFFGVEVSLIEELADAVGEEQPDLTATAAPDGTVTIVFTDIEDSTALNASFGDRGWMEVLAAHNTVIVGATRENGGTVVKGQGDGFMLAFPSARRGLETARAIQSRIAKTFDDPGSPIRVRIGVHVGEVLRQADDFFGHAVNYAARVAAAAAGGEALVSSLVRDLVAPTGDFSFGEGREVEFKGVDGSQRVYPLDVA